MERSLRNLALVYIAAWMRSFNIGLIGVVLGVYLSRKGFSEIDIGSECCSGICGWRRSFLSCCCGLPLETLHARCPGRAQQCNHRVFSCGAYSSGAAGVVRSGSGREIVIALIR